jgi:hypothetical protein
MTRAYTASRRQIATLRLAAQGIDAPAFDTPVEVVRHMLAIQAQDFPGAKWSVGLRTVGATDADVEAAIAAREIVRSWPMRGTLHFAPAEDLGWMLGLTRDRMVRGAAGRHRQLELDDASFALAARIAERELSRSDTISRTGLLAAFDAAGLSTAGQRGTHLLWYLNVTGLLVFGPLDGKQHSFALMEQWVRTGRALTGDEALAEFARRYFRSHGPATDRDFAWWSSLTLTEARRGLAAIAIELEKLEIDGTTYYHRAGLKPAGPGVLVLPGFDEYVLGYQNRTAQLAVDWGTRIVPGGNGMFLSTVVVDGEIVGTWKRTPAANHISVELVPFSPLTVRSRKAAHTTLQRYAGFVSKPVKLL